MRKLSLTAAVLAAMAFSAQPAIAQQLSLSILNSGKAPDAPVPVKVVEDGQETVVATADRRGDAEVDISVLPVGTRVCVKIVNGEVHIVPKGDEDCGDDVIGMMNWGATDHINVDIGTGAFSSGRMTYGGVDRWRVGLGIDYAKLTNLEDTGCLNAQSCDPDDSGVGFNGFVEYDLTDHWHAGLGFSYRTFTLNQDFGGGDVSQVETDVLGTGLYGGFHTPLGEKSRFSLNVGMNWLCNKADIRSVIGGETFVEDRSEGGLRAHTGATIDWSLSDKWGMRIGAGYVVGDEDDADTNVYGGVALSVSF